MDHPQVADSTGCLPLKAIVQLFRHILDVARCPLNARDRSLKQLKSCVPITQGTRDSALVASHLARFVV